MGRLSSIEGVLWECVDRGNRLYILTGNIIFVKNNLDYGKKIIEYRVV